MTAARGLLVGVVLGMAAGWAQAGARRAGVHLHLDACVAAQAEVRRLFAIELDVELAAEASPVTARVRARCADGGLVDLEVDDPLTGKSLRRSIDLAAAAARARPRLLALALAELLFASWAELEVSLSSETRPAAAPPAEESQAEARQDVPVPTPAVLAAQAEARQAARLLVRRHLPVVTPPSGVRVLAASALEALLHTGAVLAGAAIRIGADHGRHLGWALDVAYLHGRGTSDLGALTADSISGGAVLLFQHGLRRRGVHIGLRAGGGLRAGAAQLAGTPADGTRARGGNLWGPLVGPTGVLSGSLALPRRLAAELTIEGGHILTPLYGRVAGVRAVALEGPWLGLQLAVGGMP